MLSVISVCENATARSEFLLLFFSGMTSCQAVVCVCLCEGSFFLLI